MSAAHDNEPFMKIDRSLGAKEVRALAHPLRLRMLELLREGPATATTLANELGESTGATSYHLRALERGGFIEEDTQRGTGRERWWTVRVPTFLVSSRPADDAEYEAAIAQLQEAILGRDERALAGYFGNLEQFDDDWRETAFVGGWLVYATREEVEEISQAILRAVAALRRPAAERPAGARLLHVTYRALPVPEEAD